MKKTISIGQIDPTIRFASFHQLEGGYDSTFRHLKHYQMMYVYKGMGEFIVSNRSYIGEKGNLLFWSSKEAHRVRSSKCNPLTIFGLQFDLTKEYEKIVYPISWYSPKNYDIAFANENIKLLEIPTMPNKFNLDNISFYEKLLFQLVKEYRSKRINSLDICNAILKTLLMYTFRNYLNDNNKDKKTTINDMIQFIYDHLDENITSKTMSHKFNYHINHINRLFNTYTNRSLHQFIIEVKIDRAIEYMQSTNLNITQIANKLGYTSIHYFSKQFKVRTGITPSSFMKR